MVPQWYPHLLSMFIRSWIRLSSKMEIITLLLIWPTSKIHFMSNTSNKHVSYHSGWKSPQNVSLYNHHVIQVITNDSGSLAQSNLQSLLGINIKLWTPKEIFYYDLIFHVMSSNNITWFTWVSWLSILPRKIKQFVCLSRDVKYIREFAWVHDHVNHVIILF